MTLNSSSLPGRWCLFQFYLNVSKAPQFTIRQLFELCCHLTSMAVVGNALILTAVWKNPSLRTPSYVLLAGLAFTDFCTGLLSQPFFVIYQLAVLAGNRKVTCFGGVITQGVAYFSSSLTVIFMTIIAVERWLHMSRRSVFTVR